MKATVLELLLIHFAGKTEWHALSVLMLRCVLQADMEVIEQSWEKSDRWTWSMLMNHKHLWPGINSNIEIVASDDWKILKINRLAQPTTKTMAGVGHLKRICKDVFSVAGAIQETCSSELLGGPGADFLRGVAFWSLRSLGLLRWFCVTGAALRMTWHHFFVAGAVV